MFRLIYFKTERQALEWENPRLDRRLRVITYALAGFTFDNFGKPLLITEIKREEAERREIYKDDPELREKLGVHEVWRAIDYRLKGFTPEEIAKMVKFLNDNFIYTGKLATALAHVVIGFHLHVQTDSDGVTEIKGGPVTTPLESTTED